MCFIVQKSIGVCFWVQNQLVMYCFLQWRDRLVGALKQMKAGELAQLALNQVCKTNGSIEDRKNDLPVFKVLVIPVKI